jgi:hypothetical protein
MSSLIRDNLACYYASSFYSNYNQTIGVYLDQVTQLNVQTLGKNIQLFWNCVSNLATNDITNQVIQDMTTLYNSVDLSNKKALEDGYAIILNKYTTSYLINATNEYIPQVCVALGIDPNVIIYPNEN